MAKITKKASKVVLDVDKIMQELDYEKGLESAVRLYVEANWENLAADAKHVNGGMDAEEYVVGSIQNAIYDGEIEELEDAPADDVEDADKDSGPADDDQEIVEVSQEEVKKALKVLLTTQNNIMALLYEKHAEYNEKYFNGDLSIPLITIEKLSNRTLGNYTFGRNNLPVKNHIRFNPNFIALNQGEDGKCTRILETLVHEMIHQWQDQVLYMPFPSTEVPEPTPKAIKIPTLEEGEVVYKDGISKKRPKEWHNPDFKQIAAVVGIPAKGKNCTGNPCNMPEPKSYNRKYVCGCVATNGYPVTIWSTRTIFAQCLICEKPFEEVEKKDKKAVLIEVNTSHVEKPNQDGVHDAMKAKYRYFERFEDKGKRDLFVEGMADDLDAKGGYAVTDMEKGTYQKNHNAYEWGYRYWVAFNTDEIFPDTIHPEEVRTEPKAPKLKKEKPEAKKMTGKIVKFPVKEPEKEPQLAPDDLEAVEKAFESEADLHTQPEEVTSEPRVFSLDNPQDVIDAYIAGGSTRKAAEFFGVHQTTYTRRAQKYGIDFNEIMKTK